MRRRASSRTPGSTGRIGSARWSFTSLTEKSYASRIDASGVVLRVIASLASLPYRPCLRGLRPGRRRSGNDHPADAVAVAIARPRTPSAARRSTLALSIYLVHATLVSHTRVLEARRPSDRTSSHLHRQSPQSHRRGSHLGAAAAGGLHREARDSHESLSSPGRTEGRLSDQRRRSKPPSLRHSQTPQWPLPSRLSGGNAVARWQLGAIPQGRRPRGARESLPD